MNIGLIIIAILGGLAGGLSTIYICASLPAILVWKVYRKIAQGISLMN